MSKTIYTPTTQWQLWPIRMILNLARTPARWVQEGCEVAYVLVTAGRRRHCRAGHDEGESCRNP